MGKEQFLVQAEANLSFCCENKLHVTEQRSVCKADCQVSQRVRSFHCPSTNLFSVHEYRKPFSDPYKVSAQNPNLQPPSSLFALPFYPFSPATHLINIHFHTFFENQFLFSKNTVASQRWFLLHSVGFCCTAKGIGHAHTRILFSGLPSHSGLHRGLSGAPCAGCFQLLSLLVNSKKHLLRPSTRSGIALVSGRRGKRVENETACQHSKSSKSNGRYSHNKNTSQVQLRVS